MRQLLVFLCLLLAGTADATTWTWPGPAAPCNAGLQACIDGVAAGDVVELATNTPITLEGANPLALRKSVTLRSAVGFSPQMADFTLIQAINEGATGPVHITVEGIHLPQGAVQVVHVVDQPLTTTVRRMRIENPFNQLPAVGVRQAVNNASAMLAGRVEDNDILVEGRSLSGTIYASSAVSVSSSVSDPGPLDIDVAWNRVHAINTGQQAIMSLYALGEAGHARFHGNRIEGRDFNAGISIASGAGANYPISIANNVILGQNGNVGLPAGIAVSASQGTLDVLVINNTVIHGRNGILISARTDLGGMVYGALVNNIVAFHRSGGIIVENALDTPPLAAKAGPKGVVAPVVNAHNLVHANAYDEFTPGPGTLTSHPRLRHADFRLRDDSPARNAGAINAAYMIDSRGFPLLDVDGLRRVKDGAIDIGAHEVGARSTLHVTHGTNTFDHITYLDWDAINGNAGMHFVATHNWNPPGLAGVYNNHHAGAYLSGSPLRWSIYNQSLGPMPLGAGFNLFLPDAGSGMGHLTSAGNTSGGQTFLSSPELDASPDLFVHARHHWNGHGSAGVYLNHPIFVGHFDEAWRLVVPAPATMPLGTGFTLTLQERSPNAFFHRAASGNISVNWTRIDHPRLNGIHCAQLSVTPSLLANNPRPIGVWYTGTQHAIYNEDGSAMPVDANFFVSFDPAQVESCSRTELFADGFE